MQKSDEILELGASIAPKASALMADVAVRNIGRETIVRATMLALISGRPAFFLGSPGINKTGTVQDIVHQVDGTVFYDALMPTIVSVEQLLVESTSIKETPTSDGGKEISTSDKLGRVAKAHIFLADEIWKSEPRVLNTVLDLAKGGLGRITVYTEEAIRELSEKFTNSPKHGQIKKIGEKEK